MNTVDTVVSLNHCVLYNNIAVAMVLDYSKAVIHVINNTVNNEIYVVSTLDH